MKIKWCLLAALFIASPAFAQTLADTHANRAAEDQVRGLLRQEAEQEFRANDPGEARDTCRELVAHIDSTRWRTPGELAEQREWAQKCYDGTYQPYHRETPVYSPEGSGLILAERFGEAASRVNALLPKTPYDGDKDPDRVFQDTLNLIAYCVDLAPFAKAYRHGAVGLVAYCQGVANVIQDRTLKPKKKHYYCMYFAEARDDFVHTDIAASPFRVRIESAQQDSLAMLARPECVGKGKH